VSKSHSYVFFRSSDIFFLIYFILYVVQPREKPIVCTIYGLIILQLYVCILLVRILHEGRDNYALSVRALYTL